MREEQSLCSPSIPGDVYDFTLTIKEACVTDTGEWCCEVKCPNGKISSVCNLKIFETLPERENPPLFVKHLENVTVNDSDDIHLQCQVDGNPKPDITWFKNGKEVQNDDRHAITYTKETGICALTVSPFVLGEDQAAYTCSAQNSTGVATTEGTLTITVKEEPRPPEPELPLMPKTKIVKRMEKVKVKKTVYQRKLKPTEPEINKSIIVEKEQNGSSEIYLREFYKNDMMDTAILKQLIGWEEEDKLYFSVHLKSKCAVDGSHAVLNCVCTGLPPFDIKWLKDGNELLDSERYFKKSIGGLQSLEVVEVTLDDTGQYTCQVSNKQGQITSSCYLQIEPVFDPHIDYQQPRIVRDLLNISVVEGQDAMLVCAAKGNPMPGFKWYKDSRSIHESDRISMSFDEVGVATLYISRVVFSDKGLYTCEAHNLAGRCKTTTTISVRERKEPLGPEYVEIPVEIEVDEEREVDVEVEATPEPEPEPEPPRYIPDELCHVECTSTVNARGADFTIQLPKFLEIKNGKRLFLKCHVDGFPTPNVEWMKDDKLLKNTDHTAILSLGNWHGLEIAGLDYKFDTGCYTIVVDNDVKTNKSSCFVEVLVHGKSDEMQLSPEKNEIIPPSDDFEVLLSQTCLYGEVLYIPALLTTGLLCHASPLRVPNIEPPSKYRESPHFTQELEPAYYPLEVDDNVTMECVVAGNPSPQVVWYHDGVMVENTRNVHTVWEPVTHRAAIVIRFMHILDTGRYECLAYSNNGHCKTTTQLHIKRLDTLGERIDKVAEDDLQIRELSSPEFTGKLHDRVVYEGDLVRLECVSTGIPPPRVQWLKEDKELFSTGNMNIRSEDSLHHLEILDVSSSDHGYYTCEASNSQGKTATRALLTVEGAEEGEITDVEYGRPVFLETIRSISVSAGLDALLKCVVRGNPRPKLRWQKDMIDLFQSDRLQTTLNKAGEATLRIRNVQASDAGMYMCIAKNRAGRVKASATIRVTEKRRMTWSGDSLTLPSLNPIFLRPRSGSMDPEGSHLGGMSMEVDSLTSDTESEEPQEISTDHISMPLIEEGEEEEEVLKSDGIQEDEAAETQKEMETVEKTADEMDAKEQTAELTSKATEDAAEEKMTNVENKKTIDTTLTETIEDDKVEEISIPAFKPESEKSQEPLMASKPDVVPQELPAPFFKVYPRSQWVMANTEIQLIVRVVATSKPDVTWTKDGHIVSYDNHYVGSEK